VVDDLALSPDPPRAMLTSEYAYLIQGLAVAGARFVTFSEAAAEVARDNPGNRLRNTSFAMHGFVVRPPDIPIDWFPIAAPAVGGTIRFPAAGQVRMASPQPATLVLRQTISPVLFKDPSYVLRARTDLAGLQSGTLTLGLRGPLGERLAVFDSSSGEFCLEIVPAEITAAGAGETDVLFEVKATGLTGVALLSDFELLPRRRRQQECRFAGGGNR
jgi:hypothetical protein